MTEPDDQPARPAGFGHWMTSLWMYTILRVVLFLALWGILLLLGVSPLLAALLAAVLSVPLSLVLLARPRNRLTANLSARLEAQRVRREELDRELDPDQDEDVDGIEPTGVESDPDAGRSNQP